jgi:hypothetical protein
VGVSIVQTEESEGVCVREKEKIEKEKEESAETDSISE